MWWISKLHIECVVFIAILIYFSLHAVFSLTLKIFSSFLSFIFAFFNHNVLTVLLFLKFLLAIFNSSPYSTYVYNFCIVSFDVIRPLQGFCYKQGFTKFLKILPNCSVGVTVAVDTYVNSRIYFFSFFDFFWFTLDLYILGPLKCLMTSGSIVTANSLFLWVSLLILFFSCICKT